MASGANRKRTPVLHPTDPSLFIVPLTRGYFAVIDAIDVSEIGQYAWRAHGKKPYVYAATGSRGGLQLMHRVIGSAMGLSLAAMVDHRNGNTLDCRRSNLRDATRAQNLANAKMPRNNTSGHKGVTYVARYGKWQAQIKMAGKNHFLGYFHSATEAAHAADDARLRLHGEFSRCN